MVLIKSDFVLASSQIPFETLLRALPVYSPIALTESSGGIILSKAVSKTAPDEFSNFNDVKYSSFTFLNCCSNSDVRMAFDASIVLLTGIEGSVSVVVCPLVCVDLVFPFRPLDGFVSSASCTVLLQF